MSKVFFANSGAEATKALLLARKYSFQNTQNRNKILSLKNSFHGRTATLKATGQENFIIISFPFLKAFNMWKGLITITETLLMYVQL